MRGAAAFRGRGQRPRPLNMPAAGLARQRAGGRSPPAAAPPSRWVFHRRQKTQRKSQAFRPTQPRSVHHPEKGGSDREPLRGRLQPSRRAERAFFRRGAATE